MAEDPKYVKVPGFPDYYATRSGEVYSSRDGKMKLLKPEITKHGYARCRVFNEARILRTGIHRIIAMTFIPRHNETDILVNHKNGNKLDNRAENLEWCTASYNSRHAFHVLKCNRIPAKVSDNHVAEIRRLYAAGIPPIELLRRYAVSDATIYRIITSQSPYNTVENMPRICQKRKVTEDEVEAIRALHAGGMKQVEIIAKYGLGCSTISQIITHKVHKVAGGSQK